jgi:hypothetical protein
VNRLAGITLLAIAPHAALAQSQVELTVGAGAGSSFTRRGPFVFDGVSFAEAYRTCPPEANAAECAQAGAADVTFGLENKYPSLVAAGVEARRGVGGPFLAGAGVLGGLALRSQRIAVGDTGQVVEGRPVLPDEVSSVAESHLDSSLNGVGALAYVHAGLRWERGFESRTAVGYRPSGTRVFLEAGGGWLAALPGGGAAGVGHPPGAHLAAGVIFKRTSARPLTLSARYVRALGKRDEATLVTSHLSWVLLQVGWRLGAQ